MYGGCRTIIDAALRYTSLTTSVEANPVLKTLSDCADELKCPHYQECRNALNILNEYLLALTATEVDKMLASERSTVRSKLVKSLQQGMTVVLEAQDG